ncbi:MAG: methylenetetrahydrofolate reductase [Nocardioidaceae bacterium]
MGVSAGPGGPPGCPKHMVFGPCGGVRTDLSCEVDDRPCPFATHREPVPWTESARLSAPDSDLLRSIESGRPVVVTDLSLPPYDAAMVVRLTEVLRGACDALLVGEHQDQPDFPPTLMAQLLGDHGARAWITLTCRDRNRIVLEQELAGLHRIGADGVLCVTGDARAPGVRPDVTQVFDLDGTRLAALAAFHGLAVAVPESPAAAPVAVRPGRLLQKQRAGAHVAILNHVGTAAAVEDFVVTARQLGVTLPVVVAVGVYTDVRSAEVLASLPGLEMDRDRVARVLGASDPERAGIDSAVEEARRMLAIEQVAGVNLSGSASGRGVLRAAEVKAEIGRRIRS